MQKFIIFNIFLVSSFEMIHPKKKKNVRVTINYERDKRLLLSV